MIVIENCSHLITDMDVGEINGLLRELSPKLINFAVTKNGVRQMLDRSFIFLARERDDQVEKTRRGHIIGMATVVFFYKLTGLVGVVEDVVVKQNRRGMGVGKILMETIVKESEERHVMYLDLTSNPSRKAAWGLYKKIGFTGRDTANFRLSIKNSA